MYGMNEKFHEYRNHMLVHLDRLKIDEMWEDLERDGDTKWKLRWRRNGLMASHVVVCNDNEEFEQEYSLKM
jgi:hypothetical protein